MSEGQGLGFFLWSQMEETKEQNWKGKEVKMLLGTCMNRTMFGLLLPVGQLR